MDDFEIEQNKGFIRAVLIIILALVVLSYFGFDGEEVIKSERVQDALNATGRFLSIVWHDFIVRPVLWIWNEVFIDIAWEKIIEPIVGKVSDIFKK